MAGLVQETIDETREKAVENISEVAMEVLEFSVITSEIDSMLDNEIQEIIDGEIHSQKEDTERMRLNMVEKRKRKAEKRKREETGDNIDPHITKRKNNESVEYITDDDSIGINETDDDLTVLKKIQSNRVILNVGGARFETSRRTLRKDPNSLLAKLFTTEYSIIPQGHSIFIDRDASHFKVMLNYLRYGLEINPAIGKKIFTGIKKKRM